jgi:hypothetical protein
MRQNSPQNANGRLKSQEILRLFMETESLSPYSHGSATGPFPKPGESCPHPTPFSQISQLTGQHYNLQMKSAQVVKYSGDVSF